MKQGYRRVKCKIKPGYDINYMRAVRIEYGDIMLMVDANSAYTLADIDLFKEMDELGLLMKALTVSMMPEEPSSLAAARSSTSK